MGCRCCRMIKSYIFGPAIIREVPPSSIRNEKKQNEIKREISTHNSCLNSNNSVISTLDKIKNLAEETSQQNVGIIEKESKLPQEKSTTRVQEAVRKANDETESEGKFPHHNVLKRLDSHEVLLEDNKGRATSRGDFSSTNKTDTAKDDVGAETSDCTLNGLSIVHSAKVEDFHEFHTTNQADKEMPDNEVDIVNVRNVSHMKNECMLDTMEKELKITRLSKTFNEDINTLNGYKKLEITETDSGKDYMKRYFESNGEIMLQVSSLTNSESSNAICSPGSDRIRNVNTEFIKDLVEERKQTTEEEEEDPEVAAALAALEAATAGEDFLDDWS
ncbi:uncharacterized protein LOC103175846 [Callorhinchus milii]|uniref:uncharacterized protein LOC103175846 n=1 Tax=Callorhinchus milii TaxID=7868 RepID=UPI0004576014|nr:uncharacterized protein LOC103175846 [Callorhinchus milii]|eukprot:gi/632944037/ref/XP_007887280.1/ PREDICTED: uncharacterized protein LOC103175846 [Callorhinchus milii]